MIVKPKGYRQLIGMTQVELADKFGISVQSLRKKEKGLIAYNDAEKLIFRNLIRERAFKDITIDDIFFSSEVS